MDYIAKSKQLSFCLNDVSSKANGSLIQPFEFFGFMKPRMWEQYAQNYMGVCLVFSKEKLVENCIFLFSDVKYLTYNKLLNNSNCLLTDRINQIGSEQYFEDYKEIIEKKSFWKHQDYSGENEFRFMSFSENKFDYITNIDACIKGIIISSFANEYSQKKLKSIAIRLKIPIFRINWSSLGISIDPL